MKDMLCNKVKDFMLKMCSTSAEFTIYSFVRKHKKNIEAF